MKNKIGSILLLFALLTALLPSYDASAQGSPITVEIQPDGDSMKDAIIVQQQPNTNYSTISEFSVGEQNTATWTTRSLLEFDLSGLPYDMLVQSATLVLTVSADYSSNTRTMNAYAINTEWTESQVKWNYKYGSTPWQTAGAEGSNDVIAEPIGSVSVADNLAPGSTVSITLSNDAVQAMRLQNFFGVKLQMETENNDLYNFYSSDDATATNRPKLIIEYIPDPEFEIPDTKWVCVNVAPYAKCNEMDLLSEESPYTHGGSDMAGVDYSESIRRNAQSAAKLLCDPYPRCINDYPIYYRLTYDAAWTAAGSTNGTLWMTLEIPGGVDVINSVPCGVGVSGKCKGYFEGEISIYDLPQNYDGGFTIGLDTGLSFPSSWFVTPAIGWTLYLSLKPFDQDCAETWYVPVPDTYEIDPTLETPLGPLGTPADYQIYPTEIGQVYMVRVEDGPWNDGTDDRSDAAVSFDGIEWMTWEEFSVDAICIDVSAASPEDDYRIIYFEATTEEFHIRVNDETAAFADNTNDPETPYQYVIGEAFLNPDCPQFTYSEEDLYTTVAVPSTDDDVPVYDAQIDPIIGGEWYGIKVTSGTWNENSPTTPRIDMEFSFIIFGPQQNEPTWNDLAEGSPLVSCASTDGTIVYVQAPSIEGVVLHLRVNDQDTPQNFADNAGTLQVNIYHVSYAYIPTGCAEQFEVDDIVASGTARGDQVNGVGFGNTLLNPVVSPSYALTPGGWYVLQTRDGPWWLNPSNSSSGGEYEPGNYYYDVQLKTEVPSASGEWQEPEDWPLATCVVDIDALGHIRVYFRAPDNNAGDLNQGGAEYFIRAAGAGLSGRGDIRWDLYQAVDLETSTGEGVSSWGACMEQYVQSSSVPLNDGTPIPVKEVDGALIIQYGATGGGASAVTPDKDYYIQTKDGPWYDGIDPQHKYAAQLSNDGGTTWYRFPDHPDVLCAEVDPLGSYERVFFHAEVGQIWKIRVADTETEVFTDNTGKLSYSLHAVNPHGFPITTDDITDENFEACAPILIRPALMVSNFAMPSPRDTPSLPSAWDVSDWVPYLGDWFFYLGDTIGDLYDASAAYIGSLFSGFGRFIGDWGTYLNRFMNSYFAWCPRHVNIILAAIERLKGKEPLASILELQTAVDTNIAEVKSYDWGAGGEGGGLGDGYEDTSIFAFGEGGGNDSSNPDTVNRIIDRIFPQSGAGVSPWEDGDLVNFDSGNNALPAYYSTCNSAFVNFLPSRLRTGVCFASAYWRETGAAWWVQMTLDISAIFLLIRMIKSALQSLVYMMTGVRPWTKDGASKMIVEIASGSELIQPVEKWRSRR